MVTAHEIGHTLGLEHSPVRHALMSPYYRKLGRSLVLSWDDILAVQQLYGEILTLFAVIASPLSGCNVSHSDSCLWKVCGLRRSVKLGTFSAHTQMFLLPAAQV